MIVVREFEFYTGDGCVVAAPCDMGGGTFGSEQLWRKKKRRRLVHSPQAVAFATKKDCEAIIT